MTTRRRHRSAPTALLLVQNLPVPLDRRVWQEARALNRAGYDVRVICPRTPDYPAGKEVIDGIQIRRYRPGPEARRPLSYLREYSVALVAMLFIALKMRLRRRISVVHLCNPPDLLFLVALPLKALGARVIFDHHDACPELTRAKGHSGGGRAERVSLALERATFRVADVSIATNDSYRQIALTRGGMTEDNVFVVRSGPSAERFASAAPQDRWRAGRRFLVAYVGVMGLQDGLDYLVDVADLLVNVQRRTDLTFVCVGAGPELGRLRERVKALSLSDQVLFPGRLSDGELGEILATADVCVNPDEANDMNDISTMNKIMEYMALGKPIVQFDLREGRVSAGDSSLYARRNDVHSFAECIEVLLGNAKMRQRLGKIGQQRLLGELSWERQVPQLLAAYSKALDTPLRMAPAVTIPDQVRDEAVSLPSDVVAEAS